MLKSIQRRIFTHTELLNLVELYVYLIGTANLLSSFKIDEVKFRPVRWPSGF